MCVSFFIIIIYSLVYSCLFPSHPRYDAFTQMCIIKFAQVTLDNRCGWQMKYRTTIMTTIRFLINKLVLMWLLSSCSNFQFVKICQDISIQMQMLAISLVECVHFSRETHCAIVLKAYVQWNRLIEIVHLRDYFNWSCIIISDKSSQTSAHWQ